MIEKVVGGSDLEKKYHEFKAAISTVLTSELKDCAQLQGVKDKFRYSNIDDSRQEIFQ